MHVNNYAGKTFLITTKRNEISDLKPAGKKKNGILKKSFQRKAGKQKKEKLKIN